MNHNYAERHHIITNPTKSKLLCYNVDASLLGPIYLHNQSISIVSHDKHLGNYISTDILYKNILANVCDLYQLSNRITAEFHACDSETLDSLHSTFCMQIYGCELWNLTSSYIYKYILLLREKLRDAYGKFLQQVINTLFITWVQIAKRLLEKRIIKYIHNALTNNNMCA